MVCPFVRGGWIIGFSFVSLRPSSPRILIMVRIVCTVTYRVDSVQSLPFWHTDHYLEDTSEIGPYLRGGAYRTTSGASETLHPDRVSACVGW